MLSPCDVVQRFSHNRQGRDFVVGDIHGAYDLVLAAMRHVGFDKERDRLFSVGDLIDRGPGSHRCLNFLAQPYVHAVLGNHESMLLELYENGVPDEQVLQFVCQRNGLKWWLGIAKDQRTAIIDALRKLPLAIEVNTPRGLVGLVHADVPQDLSWAEFLSLLQAGDPAAIKTCLWGRSRVKNAHDAEVPGVGPEPLCA